jgi:hypothetical protein
MRTKDSLRKKLKREGRFHEFDNIAEANCSSQVDMFMFSNLTTEISDDEDNDRDTENYFNMH